MRTFLALLLVTPMLPAAEPREAEAVAKMLRELLIKKLPNPAVDTKHDWGRQVDVITGYDVKRRGPLDWTATPQTEKKNDGHWSHLVVTVPEPAKNLTLDLKDLKSPEVGKLTFMASLLAKSVDLKVEQQNWRSGIRTFSNETRANCRAAVILDCEVTRRTETKPGATLPDVVFKFKVLKAKLYYEDLQFEHTLGVGGDAAKVIGDATHKLLTRIKPSVEKDLVDKANAAIVKAASEKEVRVGFSNLFGK